MVITYEILQLKTEHRKMKKALEQLYLQLKEKGDEAYEQGNWELCDLLDGYRYQIHSILFDEDLQLYEAEKED